MYAENKRPQSLEEWAERFISGERIRRGRELQTACPVCESGGSARDGHLYIAEGNKGVRGVLLYCQHGCEQDDILKALGIKMQDLYFDDKPYEPVYKAEQEYISRAAYNYTTADGSLIHTKVVERIAQKDGKASHKKECYWKMPDGTNGKTKDKDGNSVSVPYRLEAVVPATVIYFVEGEKCADCIRASWLKGDAGRIATTLDGGAKSPWKEEYNEYFTGKEVRILPDNDEPGMVYCATVVEGLRRAGASVIKVGSLRRVFEARGEEIKESADIADALTLGAREGEIDYLTVTAGTTEADIRNHLKIYKTLPELREEVRAEAQQIPEQEKNSSDVVPIDVVPIVFTEELIESPPPCDEELIEGVLRLRHKMIIVGDSKAGKSFLALRLAIEIASGGEFLGHKIFPERPNGQDVGNVLYLNLEVADNSFINRTSEVIRRLRRDGHAVNVGDRLRIMNLRGHTAGGAKEIASTVIPYIKKENICAVVVDPLYKMSTADENSAKEIKSLMDAFDDITEAGASVIYTHHHAKGASGAKETIDRASGSGVFARDPDAFIDLTELPRDTWENALKGSFPEEYKRFFNDYTTAWEVNMVLREFRSPTPFSVIFNYPIHTVDKDGLLAQCGAAKKGSVAERRIAGLNTANENKKRKREAWETRVPEVWNELKNEDGRASLKEMSEKLGLTDQKQRSLRDYLKDKDEWKIRNGIVTRA